MSSKSRFPIEILIQVKGSAEFEAALRRAGQATDSLNQKGAVVQQTGQKIATGLNTASSAANASSTSLTKLGGVFSAAGTTSVKLTGALGGVTGGISSLTSSTNTGGSALSGYSGKLTSTGMAADSTSKNTTTLTGHIHNSVSATNSASGATDALGSSLNQTTTATGKASTATGDLSNKTSGLKDMLKGSAISMVGMGMAIQEAVGMFQMYQDTQEKVNLAQQRVNELQEDGMQDSKEYKDATNELAQAKRGMNFVLRNTISSFSDIIFFGAMLTPKFIQMAKAAGGLSGVASKLGSVFSGLKTGISAVPSALTSVTTSSTAATGAISTMPAATNAMRIGFMGATISVRTFLAALGIIGAIIAAVGIAVEAFRNNWLGFRDAVNSVGVALGNIFPFMRPLLQLIGQWGNENLVAKDKTEELTKSVREQESVFGSWRDNLVDAAKSVAEQMFAAMGKKGIEGMIENLIEALTKNPADKKLYELLGAFQELKAAAGDSLKYLTTQSQNYVMSSQTWFTMVETKLQGIGDDFENLSPVAQHSVNTVISEISKMGLGTQEVGNIIRSAMAGSMDVVKFKTKDAQQAWRNFVTILTDTSKPTEAAAVLKKAISSVGEMTTKTGQETTKATEEMRNGWTDYQKSVDDTTNTNREYLVGLIKTTGTQREFGDVTKWSADKINVVAEVTKDLLAEQNKTYAANLKTVASHIGMQKAMGMTKEALAATAAQFAQEDKAAEENAKKKDKAREANEKLREAERLLTEQYGFSKKELDEFGQGALPALAEAYENMNKKAGESTIQLELLTVKTSETRMMNQQLLKSVQDAYGGMVDFGNIMTISDAVLEELASGINDTTSAVDKQHAADIKLIMSHGQLNDLFIHNADAARQEAIQLKFNDDVQAAVNARKEETIKKNVDIVAAEQILTKELGYSSVVINKLNKKDLPLFVQLKDEQGKASTEVRDKLLREAAALGIDLTKAFQMSEAGLKNWIMTHQKVEDAVTGSIQYWNDQVDALKKQETEMKNARQWNIEYARSLGVDIPNASKMSYEQIQRVKDILESQVSKAQSVRQSLEELAVSYGMSVPNAVKASVQELNTFVTNAESVNAAQQKMAENAEKEAQRMADAWTKGIDDMQSSMSSNVDTVSKARNDDIMKGGGKGDKQSDITFAKNTFWDKFSESMAQADGSADKAIKNIQRNLEGLLHTGRVSGKEMRLAMGELIAIMNDPKLSNDERIAKMILNMDKLQKSAQYTVDGFHYFGKEVKANFDSLGVTITQALQQGKDPLQMFTLKLEEIRKTSGMTTSQFRDNFAGITAILKDTSLTSGQKMQEIIAILGNLDPATKEMIMGVESNFSNLPAITEYYMGSASRLTLKEMKTFKDKWGISLEEIGKLTNMTFNPQKKMFKDIHGNWVDLGTAASTALDTLSTKSGQAVKDTGTLADGTKTNTDATGGAFTTMKDTVFTESDLIFQALQMMITGFGGWAINSVTVISQAANGFPVITAKANAEKPKIQAANLAIGQSFNTIVTEANKAVLPIGKVFLNITQWATMLRDNFPAIMTGIGKTFGIIVTEANKAVVPIGQVFLGIATWATQSRDGLPAIMTGIGKSFGNIWTEASKHINNIGQIFIGIATWATQLRDNLPSIMSQIGGTFQILVNTSAQMVTGVNSHFATIAALIGTLRTGIPEAMSDIGNSFQILVSASGTMVTGVNSHLQILAALVGTLRTEMPEAMTDIGNSFESFVIAGLRYKPAVNGLFLNIGNGAAALMNNMPAAMTQIGRTFGNIASEGGKHTQAINNLFIMIATGAGTLRTGMPTTMRNIGGSFIFVAAEATKHKQAIQNQFNYIGNAAAALMNNMPAAMGAVGRTFSNVVTEGNKYKTGISNLFLMIAGGAATLRDGLPAVMNKIGSYFGIIVNASAPMVRGIRDHLGFVKSDITNILLMSMINASTVVGQQSRTMSTSFGTMASVIARTALVAQGRVNALRLAINALQSKAVTITTVHRTVNSVVKAAKGFEGVVNTPTTFQVAEGGKPEHVAVTPLTGRGKTNTRSVSRIDSRTAPLLQQRNSNLEKGGTIVLESPIYLDGRKISESTRKYNLATLGAKT